MSGGARTNQWPKLPPHLSTEIEFVDTNPRLLVRRPELPEVEIVIEKERFVIGRETPRVDLALDDDLVSKRHAELSFHRSGHFILDDLGSTNGIVFQGQTVRRINLVDGDVFHIGDTEIQFRVELPAPPEPEPTAGEAATDWLDDLKVPPATSHADAGAMADDENAGPTADPSQPPDNG